MIQYSRKTLRLALVAIVIAACAGCVTPAAPAIERANHLKQALTSLNAEAPPDESRLLAETALERTRQLTEEYDLMKPPQLHNILVNMGLRSRGLCGDWTTDLLRSLRALPLQHYEFHWGKAHGGDWLREHNSVVVTARGAEFDTGLVLDPWRESGELVWVLVTDDTYPWHRSKKKNEQ